jgi:hypothetical protein
MPRFMRGAQSVTGKAREPALDCPDKPGNDKPV